MIETERERRHAVALFRYGLIADLVQLKPGTKGLYGLIEHKALGEYTIPGSTRTRVAAETIRSWLTSYRRGGFEALMPRPRADQGQPRTLPAAVAEVLLGIKEERPALSVQLVIRTARDHPEVPAELPLPVSTVHRLLSRHGLMSPTRGEGGDNDRRRFAFERAGQLWMSDVMHGPTVAVGDRTRRKSYLIALLDDATRVIPYSAFALSENTQHFLAVLKQALLRRGIPERLYVDNGSAFRSQHLALVCARLGISLIHARAYRPQGKGKIERWFKTVRAQLLTRLEPPDTASLEALNRRLWTWVEGEYHHNDHRGLQGRSPLQHWCHVGEAVRFPEPGVDLDEVFLFELPRKVHKDRTVSLNGVPYEVDAALVGETVTVRFDPGAPPGRPVQICYQGKPIEQARPVETYANCFVKRTRPARTLDTDTPAPEPPPSTLRWRELPEHED